MPRRSAMLPVGEALGHQRRDLRLAGRETGRARPAAAGGRPRKRRTCVDHRVDVAHRREVRPALELHELRTRDGGGERPALGDRSRPVLAAVQHQGRRRIRGERADARPGRRPGRSSAAAVSAEEAARWYSASARRVPASASGAKRSVSRSEPSPQWVASSPSTCRRLSSSPMARPGGPPAVQHEPRDRLRPVRGPLRGHRRAERPAEEVERRRADRLGHGRGWWPAPAPWCAGPRTGPRARSPGGRSAPASGPTTAPRGTCARPGSTSRARDG